MNEIVKPHRETAHFWNSVWQSAGRPINTELHKIMKRTKNLYHYHVRKCKRSEDKIKATKLLNSCLNGENDLFTEIKSILQIFIKTFIIVLMIKKS